MKPSRDFLDKLNNLFKRLIDDGLYVQIISSKRDTGEHFYYLKVYKIHEYCDLCRKHGKGHNFDCRVEIEQKSVWNKIYTDLPHLFGDVIDVYKGKLQQRFT